MSDDFYSDPQLYDLMFPSEPHGSFYREEAARTGGPVLELACGTGKLILPMAQSGFRAVGLDISTAMLRAASSRAEASSALTTLREGDMRAFHLDERFALIFLARNSLLHLHSTEDLVACFECVSRHLLPEGKFVFDVFNPNVAILSHPPGERYPVMKINHPERGEITIEAESDYDAATQVNRATWYFSDQVQPDYRTAPLHLRSIYPQELPLLLAAGGLRLDTRYGDFPSKPFVSDSPRQICICHSS